MHCDCETIYGEETEFQWGSREEECKREEIEGGERNRRQKGETRGRGEIKGDKEGGEGTARRIGGKTRERKEEKGERW